MAQLLKAGAVLSARTPTPPIMAPTAVQSIAVRAEEVKSKVETYKHKPNSYRTVLSDEAIDDLFVEVVPGKNTTPATAESESGAKVLIYSYKAFKATEHTAKPNKTPLKFFTPEMTVRFSRIHTIGEVYVDKQGKEHKTSPVEGRRVALNFQTEFMSETHRALSAMSKSYDDVRVEIDWMVGQLKKVEQKILWALWKHPLAYALKSSAAKIEAMKEVAGRLKLEHYELDMANKEIADEVDRLGFKRLFGKLAQKLNFYPLFTEIKGSSDPDTCPLLLLEQPCCEGDDCGHPQHIRGQNKNYRITTANYVFNAFADKTKDDKNFKPSETPYETLEKKWEAENPGYSKSPAEKQADIDMYIVRHLAGLKQRVPFQAVHYRSAQTIGRVMSDEMKLKDPNYKTGPHAPIIGSGCIVRACLSLAYQYNEQKATGLKLRHDRNEIHLVRQEKAAGAVLEADEISEFYASGNGSFQSYDTLDMVSDVSEPYVANTGTSFLFGGGAATVVKQPPIDTPTSSTSASYVPPVDPLAPHPLNDLKRTASAAFGETGAEEGNKKARQG